MKQAVQKNEIFVADYLWEKSIVFARVNLAGEELRLFERIFKIFSEKQLLPNLVIYLHRPTEKLLHQINRRGREFEKNIQPEYLGKVASGYREMFASENRMPVLWLDNEKGVEALSEEVLKLIRKHFANGLHHNP